MYEQFFGMTGTPFAKDIKISDMYRSSSFKELLKRFEYIKEYRGIMTLSGEPGTGKTTAIRFFMDSLNNQSFFPVYLPLATVGVIDFYKQLNRTLNGEDIHVKSRVFQSIQQQITAYAIQKNIIPVIIFDEAHLLKEQNIRELQIISNFDRDTLDPAIIILVGQTVLLDKLKKKILQSFYQRISLKYRMEPVIKKETKEYILHHFKLCKCEHEILTEPAFAAVHNLSMGNIRLIGKLVQAALIYCFGEKKDKITEEDILTVSSEVL